MFILEYFSANFFRIYPFRLTSSCLRFFLWIIIIRNNSVITCIFFICRIVYTICIFLWVLCCFDPPFVSNLLAYPETSLLPIGVEVMKSLHPFLFLAFTIAWVQLRFLSSSKLPMQEFKVFLCLPFPSKFISHIIFTKSFSPFLTRCPSYLSCCVTFFQYSLNI